MIVLAMKNAIAANNRKISVLNFMLPFLLQQLLHVFNLFLTVKMEKVILAFRKNR